MSNYNIILGGINNNESTQLLSAVLGPVCYLERVPAWEDYSGEYWSVDEEEYRGELVSPSALFLN